MNKLIVISGCSGGGKSTLIYELNKKGYSIISEVGRELVKEQIALKSGIIPWQNPIGFCEMLIEKSIVAHHRAKQMENVKNGVVFFDRCFLEGISYFQTLERNDADKYDHLISDLRYYPIIFMTPPWREIFTQDAERKKSFEEGVAEYERLLKAYPKYGYNIVEIPKIEIEKRVEFVLSYLQ